MSYLLQANIYISLTWLGYSLFFKKETFYSVNRFYLVGFVVMSFVVPSLDWNWLGDWFRGSNVNSLINQYKHYNLNEIVVMAQKSNAFSFYWETALLVIYSLGLLFSIIRMSIKGLNTYKEYKTQNPSYAFTFFKDIKISKDLSENLAIVEHERVHAEQLHSLDIMIMEFAGVVCWFNPCVGLIKNELILLHEYIADQIASEKLGSKYQYASLLVSYKLKANNMLGSSFNNQNLLKNRLVMLAKEKSCRKSLWKYGLSFPMVGVMVILTYFNLMANKAVEVKLTEFKSRVFNAEKVEQPPVEQAQIEVGEVVPEFPPLPPIEKPVKVEITPIEVKEEADLEDKPNEVFIAVEQNPEFEGGDREMYRYLSRNVRYPEAAQKANISGRVTVQFVVENDGTVSEAKVLKGIGYGCDEEAIRVISTMPKWKPGRQNGKPVRVFYTIPVTYTLAD